MIHWKTLASNGNQPPKSQGDKILKPWYIGRFIASSLGESSHDARNLNFSKVLQAKFMLSFQPKYLIGSSSSSSSLVIYHSHGPSTNILEEGEYILDK